VLSERHGGIVTRREHETVQEVPHRENVARSELGRGSADGGCSFGDLKQSFLCVEFDFPNDLNDNEARHDLGE